MSDPLLSVIKDLGVLEATVKAAHARMDDMKVEVKENMSKMNTSIEKIDMNVTMLLKNHYISRGRMMAYMSVAGTMGAGIAAIVSYLKS